MQAKRAYHEAMTLSSHRGDFFVNPHIKLFEIFVLTSCLIRVII